MLKRFFWIINLVITALFLTVMLSPSMLAFAGTKMGVLVFLAPLLVGLFFSVRYISEGKTQRNNIDTTLASFPVLNCILILLLLLIG